LGTGAIETPFYDREIVSIVRTESPTLTRIPDEPATGAPTRYFEQLAIAVASDTDPRNISAGLAVSGPNRVERAAFIKAFAAQSNISLFDRDTTFQQGTYAGLADKDIADLAKGITRVRAQQLWSGTDTSLISPTSTQYVGLLTQITQQATIAPGASIIDGLKAQVATMYANTGFVVRPSAIYLNPVLGNYIDAEAKAAKIELREMVVAGVVVNAIATQAGVIPLIGDPFVPVDTASKYGFAAPPAGNKNYYAVIVQEDMWACYYIGGETGNSQPRIFQLGLVSDLAQKYVAVKFDTIVARGASYAHSVACVNRP
jgi:hypothetical protein